MVVHPFDEACDFWLTASTVGGVSSITGSITPHVAFLEAVPFENTTEP